ncbi:SHOCT domain-containing protein [Nocardioides sp. NPDC092400]|uniref:SHOCT domain-containing protein n=1 Tax=Nocardioides sp. NPDC092400 TaxID=3155196 RepID=UPI003425B864
MSAATGALALGLVSNQVTMTIFKDGTFSTKPAFGSGSTPDRLLGFDHDIDSMRRKSVTGRGGAALLTGGLSLLASNNRGVVYVTVVGERTNVRTYTTRNPTGTALSTIRSLKAAADAVIAQRHEDPVKPLPVTPSPAASPAVTSDAAAEVAQIVKLAELYDAGVLTLEEFRAAKARLLGI